MMNEATAQFLVARILDCANDAISEAKESKDDYHEGRKFAYYEVLSLLKYELYARDENIEEYGLNINLEKVFLSN